MCKVSINNPDNLLKTKKISEKDSIILVWKWILLAPVLWPPGCLAEGRVHKNRYRRIVSSSTHDTKQNLTSPSANRKSSFELWIISVYIGKSRRFCLLKNVYTRSVSIVYDWDLLREGVKQFIVWHILPSAIQIVPYLRIGWHIHSMQRGLFTVWYRRWVNRLHPVNETRM